MLISTAARYRGRWGERLGPALGSGWVGACPGAVPFSTGYLLAQSVETLQGLLVP